MREDVFDKPFICGPCWTGYDLIEDLSRHYKNHHGVSDLVDTDIEAIERPANPPPTVPTSVNKDKE